MEEAVHILVMSGRKGLEWGRAAWLGRQELVQGVMLSDKQELRPMGKNLRAKRAASTGPGVGSHSTDPRNRRKAPW